MTSAKERRAWLAEAAAAAKTTPMKISVRQLLAKWDAQRRGYWIVQRIEADLSTANLRTEPPFTAVWIDASVRLVCDTPVKDDDAIVDPLEAEVGLRIGQLPSANTGLVSIKSTETLAKAQALMMRHDFSQLPVLSGVRDPTPKALTWESIAQARVRQRDVAVQDVLVPAAVVNYDDDLIAAIPRIVAAGFVLVRDAENKISGLVTTSDLSVLFADLASPFLMLGEIERRLRRINGRALSATELAAARAPGDDGREITGPSDLTLGEHERLMENPATWDRYGWDLDRVEFIKALAGVRAIRNDVMHFNTDPLTPDQLAELSSFLKWIRSLDASAIT